MVKPCWRIGGGMERSKINPRNNDGLTWYKDIGFHAFGEFSMAMTQANSVMEDQCQIESGPLTFNNPAVEGTFVGVYDGHGGPEASRFIADNIFHNLKKIASEDRAISEEVMRKVYAETEEDFMVEVKKQWRKKPEMASVGSCCLTGVICDGLVYIANAGDSRAVLGRCERGGERAVKAVELSVEHNANVETARKEMWSMHPNDPNILVMKHGKWRVKGVIDVTRSIGDAYLKRAEFNREPLMQKFRLPEDFNKPILSANPSVSVTRLNREDEFIILASDGLWEQLGNQEAVDIVHNSPRRQGIARRLIKAALKEAAKKREMRYSDLKEIDSGVRRHFHDDICVIVVYLKPNASSPPLLSIRGGYPL